MIKHKPFMNIPILILTLFAGLGLALALPWLEGTQIHAAQIRTNIQNKTPEVTRYYVAKTGDNSDPTLGWSTANQNLQDTLIQAFFGGGGEIWVAAGVYYPDEGGGHTDNAPTSTFLLFDNIWLVGGFDTNDTKLSDRDWVKNVTVLSGDIDGNDITNDNDVVTDPANIKGVNAYHVVSASGVINTSGLDGFTITAGQASGGSSKNRGGGFYCDGSGIGNDCSPILSNVLFSGNSADSRGGAMYNEGSFSGSSSPHLLNVTFSSNTAGSSGGAMFNEGYDGSSSPFLSVVTFSGNRADHKGGAMYNDGSINGTSIPRLINVTFSRNTAGQNGGAMYNDGYQGISSPSLREVNFSGNSADQSGGAIFNGGSSSGFSNPSLINVVFSGNSADDGGAMYNDGSSGTSSPDLTNVTFSGNSAISNGGAIYNDGRFGGISSLKVHNSIVWNNLITGGSILRNEINRGTDVGIADNIYNDSSTTTIYHSLIQGSGGSSNWIGGSYVDGGGNIDTDPLFITTVDPATAPTTAGNLRLPKSSPAVDEGNNVFVSVDFDLDNKERIVDGDMDGTKTVDMGAFETYPYDIFVPLIIQ